MEKSFTLILAATIPKLGIGKNGMLPWKLSQDMKFFRQVTTMGGVVIMGRRTWESIPPKFRPLSDRINVIITRNPADFMDQYNNSKKETVLACTSLDHALTELQRLHTTPKGIFIIGGGQLYRSALSHPNTKHVLLTELKKQDGSEVDCDTFFEEFPWYPKDQLSNCPWKRQSYEKLKEFVGSGIEVPKDVQSDNGYLFEFTLWTRD